MSRLFTLLATLLLATSAAAARLDVCLYFDASEDGFGERSAVMVRNLLGHFQEVDVYMVPLQRYADVPLSGCHRGMYIGASMDAAMPPAFLADVARTREPFLWMNYNIWKLEQTLGSENFRAAWGFTHERIDGRELRGLRKVPDFFRVFSYKGATFRKVAQLDSQGTFVGHPEIVIVKNSSAAVLAEATHSGTKAKTPYVLRKGNLFYIADNPVTVIDERDRYLILADVLFDVLKLEPRSTKRYALARIEDVHPGYDPQLLHMTIEVFRSRKIPFAISLIPRYVGPAKRLDATQDVRFMNQIRYAVESGATILVHGYEHQLTVDLGCGVSFTGEGYEFWDVCKDAPLPFDTVTFVQRRLDRAKQILDEGKLPYAGWVTPHYAASPLAIRVVHSNFGRVVQRMKYFADGQPMTAANSIDQFFPYTIAHDYYGVHVWPENLGYVPLPRFGGSSKHVDAMLEAARANKVIRDAWASFFWHPLLIRTDLGIQSLERLVDGVRALGYEFISLHDLKKRGE